MKGHNQTSGSGAYERVEILKIQGGVFMLSTGKYASCNVAGDGKLFIEGNNKVEKFKIIDMSAAGIRLETTAALPENTAVKLKIRLLGGVVDANMDVNGKVARAIEKGYELEFTDLSDGEKEEIDELMRNTCNIEK